MNSNRSQLKTVLKAKDHLISGEEFSLLYDPVLDMLYTDPIPNDLEKYYESDAYISHTDSKKTFIDTIYQLVKRSALKSKIKLAESFVIGDKILLDVGAGTGDFVQTATLKKWKAKGIETNEKAREVAVQKNIDLLEQRPDSLSDRPTVITLWHVLEHLPDPQEYLKWIHSQLQDKGVLIIAVPNFNSWDAKHYREYWAAYDVPRHLWHFSRSAIEKLTADLFELEVIRPMVYDAFYVSMLSEKHKNGKGNLFSAFLNGLRSNWSAWSSREYSSLIYVLRKR